MVVVVVYIAQREYPIFPAVVFERFPGLTRQKIHLKDPRLSNSYKVNGKLASFAQ